MNLSDEIKYPMNLKDLKNWSCAIGYGLGSSSPLSPSFNFAIELVKSSQVCVNTYLAYSYFGFKLSSLILVSKDNLEAIILLCCCLEA